MNAQRGRTGRTTSPKTNLPLPSCKLLPNNLLKHTIKEWSGAHSDLLAA